MISSIVPTIQRSVITDLQEIGEGFFGKVYKGFYLFTFLVQVILHFHSTMVFDCVHAASEEYARELRCDVAP